MAAPLTNINTKLHSEENTDLHDTNQKSDDVFEGTEPGACRTQSVLVATESYADLERCLDSTSSSEISHQRLPSGTINEITGVDRLTVQDNNVDGTSTDVATASSTFDASTQSQQVSDSDSKTEDVDEVFTNDETESIEYVHSEQWRQHRKHVFILSAAGKPIYSRYGSEDRLVTLTGLMQALVSVVQDSGDAIRSVKAGSHHFVFIVREHVTLVGVVGAYESASQMAAQLNYVYNQLLSVLTYRQLSRTFSQRHNYDLRRLLSGAEKFFDHLLTLMDADPGFLLAAVRCLPLDSAVRDIITNSIAHNAKVKDLVFAILLAEGQLVALIHMKKYPLYPHDLHLIINLVGASESFKSAESWTPICLPKFDSNGYLHAHISYLDPGCKSCLLLMSVDRDMFFTLSDCKHKIQQIQIKLSGLDQSYALDIKLTKHGCLKAIADSVGRRHYDVGEADIICLRHFLYKSRSTAQLTCPAYGAPYTTGEQQRRLYGLYQRLHARMHAAVPPLTILFHVGSYETLLGWITPGFELYAVFGPLVTKNMAICSVNKLLKWIKKEEDRLFILNSTTF